MTCFVVKHIHLGLTNKQALSDANESGEFWKHRHKRGELLIMSNFSFYHNVFKFIQKVLFHLWRFSISLKYIFKVLCRRFVVCCEWLIHNHGYHTYQSVYTSPTIRCPIARSRGTSSSLDQSVSFCNRRKT